MSWDEDDCGEAWNFSPGNDSIVRGFIMLTAKNAKGDLTGTININTLGANNSDKHIEGITVIFYAPKPPNDENHVVGWYENAKVYRNWRAGGRRNEYRNNQPYSFEVNEKNIFLIPGNLRNIKIITSQYAMSNGIHGSFPGQSCTFFRSANPEYVDSIIDKLQSLKYHIDIQSPDNFDDPSEIFFTKEGKIKFRKHRYKERSANLVKQFKRNLKSYDCIICKFNFENIYGDLGIEFIEAHHTIPIADLDEDTIVTIDDLIPVCSNCHRMLHRKNSPEDWRKLKKIIGKKSTGR